MKFVSCAAFLFFFSASLPVAAQDAETSNYDDEEIEEIVVYGDRTLVQLRFDIYRAEEDFYELFNTLNSDDEFDVHCGKRIKVGSHIRRWACISNFAKAIYAESTWNYRLGYVDTYAEAQITMKTKALRKEMLELVDKHENLRAALMKVPRAHQVYARERMRRCTGKLICR